MFWRDVRKHGGHLTDSLQCRQLSSPSLDSRYGRSGRSIKHQTIIATIGWVLFVIFISFVLLNTWKAWQFKQHGQVSFVKTRTFLLKDQLIHIWFISPRSLSRTFLHISILILFSLKTISKNVLGSITRGWAQNHLPIPTTFKKTSNTYMEYKPASIVGFLLAVFFLLLIFYKISFTGKMILITCFDWNLSANFFSAQSLFLEKYTYYIDN